MTNRERTDARPEGEAVWTRGDAERLYGVGGWGRGLFRVTSDGHLAVTPDGTESPSIDLLELVESLSERDIRPPVLLRFHDLLAARLREMRSAFDQAIRERGYGGSYRCLYPIKVNQERYLCEEIRDLALELGFGLEAGSKPELLAVLGLAAGHGDLPIVCNGFKDDEFAETVVLATKLGRDIVPIVEKPGELDLILKHSRGYGVRPRIGLRVKLHAKGTGKWESSGGERSKFGLSTSELLRAVDVLEEAGMLDCLHLLHCHVGSQVSTLESLRRPLEELARVYVELTRIAPGVQAIDVGGGLGIDYDGSRSGRGSSIDYGVREYADLVVETLAGVCEAAGIPHPDVLSESGRAMVASSSVLVVEVVGKTRLESDPTREDLDASSEGGSVPAPIDELWSVLEGAPDRPPMETYERAQRGRDRALDLFRSGGLGLRSRALAERLYARITRELDARFGGSDDLPSDLAQLSASSSEVYFANFSLFQSLPDSWALDQVFPICPIHRLDERPTCRAILADITCDSDGEIDRFAVRGGERAALDVHGLRPEEPYLLGIFLVGAYQEILGDLHNLLGDTHAVHVRLDEEGEWIPDQVVPGDTVREVLGLVHYDVNQLLDQMRREVEGAIRRKTLSVLEGKSLLSNLALGLDGYTYLE